MRSEPSSEPTESTTGADTLRTRPRGCLHGCLLAILVLIVVLGGLKVVAYLHDAAAWKNLRAKAAWVKIGMTQNEVLEVMGKPDHRASPNRFEKETWDSWWYHAPRLIWRDREIRIDFDPVRVDQRGSDRVAR